MIVIRYTFPALVENTNVPELICYNTRDNLAWHIFVNLLHQSSCLLRLQVTVASSTLNSVEQHNDPIYRVAVSVKYVRPLTQSVVATVYIVLTDRASCSKRC
jgi:hypothetical protein